MESGISGECMRSAKNVVCDDTQLDSRVDPEVCLSLGLRSLAAVPLRAPGDALGLLEVFSNYPSNFSREHLEILRAVGDLVELAYARVSAKTVSAQSAPAEEPVAPAATVEEKLSEPRAIGWLRDSQTRAGEKRFPYWAIPVALIALLLAFRAWMAWHEPAKTAALPTVTAPQEISGDELVVLKPTPTRENRRRHNAKSDATEAQAAETPEVVVRNFKEDKEDKEDSASLTHKEDLSAEAPQLPVLNSNNGVLNDLVARQAELPTAAIPVSRGVVRGAVIHRVPPVYPAEALSLGLSGPVVLKASINEKGEVDQVSPVSGSPVLARSAVNAVKQWRYQPSLLNGTPVQVETEITVNFQKP